MKAVATGPVISTWPSSRHSISSSPPSTTTMARRPVSPRRCAFTSAAQAPEPQAQRQAGAALPHAQPDAVGRQDLGEADIGALGEQRIVLQARAEFRHRQALDVGDEERRVRIAHAGGRRIGHRPRREVEVQRVHRPRQRDVRPVEPRRPHVDAHAAVGERLGGQVAGGGADDLGAAAGLARQQIGDAAGGVAAGPGLGAVGVADAHEGIGVGVWRRRLDGDELVAADAGAPVGDRGGAAGREAERAGALVEHDEVVAAAVHLEEARHGEGICGGGVAVEGAGWR